MFSVHLQLDDLVAGLCHRSFRHTTVDREWQFTDEVNEFCSAFSMILDPGTEYDLEDVVGLKADSLEFIETAYSHSCTWRLTERSLITAMILCIARYESHMLGTAKCFSRCRIETW